MLLLLQSNHYPTISDTIKKNFGLSSTSPQGGLNQAVLVLCFGLRLTLLTQDVRVHLNEVKRAER
jgi:hypothetical protein